MISSGPSGAGTLGKSDRKLWPGDLHVTEEQNKRRTLSSCAHVTGSNAKHAHCEIKGCRDTILRKIRKATKNYIVFDIILMQPTCIN